MTITNTQKLALSHGILDLLIRAALIAALVFACYRVFRPFLDLLSWALILSITLYPIQRKLQPRLRDKAGLTATLIVLIAMSVLVVPAYFLGTSLDGSLSQAYAAVKSGSFHLPAPPDAVAHWPLVGERLHAAWSQAAQDLTSFMQKLEPQIKPVALGLLGKLADAGVGLLIFLVALVVSGILMAYAREGHRSAILIASRVFGPDKGHSITALCVGTVRAVAQGVIGIAFIQMLLVDIAFVMMDIPGTPILSLAVLLLGIMQIPVSLITVPVIIYVFAIMGVDVTTIVFAVYVFIAGLIDNVLKPLMLGRGVEVPMPVVLIGAIGGMITNGITGLFLGPVILAVGYVLFWQWVEQWPLDDQAAQVADEGGDA